MTIYLRDSATRERLSTPAVTLFGNIASRWGLSSSDTCQLLGGISTHTWRRWRDHSPVLSQDVLTRISLIIGIDRALRILFGPSLGDSWPLIPNTHSLFAGRTPIASMISGGIPQLVAVRELLEGRQEGGA
jgi:hypothetical protein